jgi:hypothetical protein
VGSILTDALLAECILSAPAEHLAIDDGLLSRRNGWIPYLEDCASSRGVGSSVTFANSVVQSPVQSRGVSQLKRRATYHPSDGSARAGGCAHRGWCLSFLALAVRGRGRGPCGRLIRDDETVVVRFLKWTMACGARLDVRLVCGLVSYSCIWESLQSRGRATRAGVDRQEPYKGRVLYCYFR